MKSKIAATVALGLTLCTWAGQAEAFQYVFKGTVTGTSHDKSTNIDYLDGQTITIAFDGVGAMATSVSSTETDLTIALRGAQATVGGSSGYFSNNYLLPSSVKNDGSTSSLSLDAETSQSQFGSLQGIDGGLKLSAVSPLANIPLNPEQSFGSISITGSGLFSATNLIDPGNGDTINGYSVFFNITSMQGFGAISAVPLPAAAPMFGAALLAFAGMGYCVKRRATTLLA